jgi:hypothetical protein
MCDLINVRVTVTEQGGLTWIYFLSLYDVTLLLYLSPQAS